MSEHREKSNDTIAATMVRVQGIVSIVMGSLGAVFGLILMIVFGISLGAAYTDSQTIEFFVLFVLSLLFIVVPHVYLIISGVLLANRPAPKIARLLTIINLVIGAISNYVILAFAIISLVQSKEYEASYHVHKK